jgi:tetratricopeptide (TPR) repeat protein
MRAAHRARRAKELAVTASLAESEFNAALQAVESATASAREKAEMLMEIAMGMQLRPASAEPLVKAIELYRRALALCPGDAQVLGARITTRLGTALQALPDGGNEALMDARACYESAQPTLKKEGTPEELAELDMNLGLVQQSLAPSGGAGLHESIQSYHRALRTFTRADHPQEFAILHNNLAIAYLSIPLADEQARMREALAVQSFEEVLKVINLVDHPSEYAMIQNNLGNALQYASSGHPLENNLRALDAYDEALKVRNARDTPLEYANTISNQANVLRNLPDDPDDPGRGRGAILRKAERLYAEARRLFALHGAAEKAGFVAQMLRDVERELAEVGAQRRPQQPAQPDGLAPRANGHSDAFPVEHGPAGDLAWKT